MKNLISEQLAEAVEGIAGSGYTVEHKEVRKNNAVTLLAIIIRKDGDNIFPTIYIDEIIDEIMEGGKTVDEAAEEIWCFYEKNKNVVINVNTDMLSDGEYILGHVEYQIVNAERNKDMLANIPNRRVEDLAVIYRAVVIDNENGTASYVINNEIMGIAGISTGELDKAAYINTRKTEFTIKTTEEIIEEFTGTDVKDDIQNISQMYILTNRRNTNGATILLYADQLAMVAEKMGGDFFILPSSIHEVIAVPVLQEDCSELKKMVKSINDMHVSPENILGYEIYRYNSRTGKLGAAS